MKKRVHIHYAAAAVLFILLPFLAGNYFSFLSLGFFQKINSFKISEKIVFVSDTFAMRDYNRIFEKLQKTENSAVVLMPQVFNIRVGDYIE
ncbi:MAG TPA: hypothetical protein ENN55_04565, partial [Firmicutes bacterium]|nr:hypothetical protein [Bacillota bacterium]